MKTPTVDERSQEEYPPEEPSRRPETMPKIANMEDKMLNRMAALVCMPEWRSMAKSPTS